MQMLLMTKLREWRLLFLLSSKNHQIGRSGRQTQIKFSSTNESVAYTTFNVMLYVCSVPPCSLFTLTLILCSHERIKSFVKYIESEAAWVFEATTVCSIATVNGDTWNIQMCAYCVVPEQIERSEREKKLFNNIHVWNSFEIKATANVFNLLKAVCCKPFLCSFFFFIFVSCQK